MSPIYNIVVLILIVQVFVAVLYYAAVHYECRDGSTTSPSDSLSLRATSLLKVGSVISPVSKLMNSLRPSNIDTLPQLPTNKEPTFSENWGIGSSAPCGNQAVHDVLVSRATAVEFGYASFVLGQRSARFPNREIVHTFRRVLDVLRSPKNGGDGRIVTVQIGCLDGRKNDPLYHSFVDGYPANKDVDGTMSLRHWHGLLVEPGFMTDLKKTYTNISLLTDMQLRNMHFVEGAINVAEKIDDQGLCHFYKVRPPGGVDGGCPSKQRWVEQISGLDATGLRTFFGERNFAKCVEDQAVPCWSPGGLLATNGFDLQQYKSAATGAPVWCHRDPTASSSVSVAASTSYQRVDILAVDVEGFDGQIVQAAFNELCPDLWPTVLLYEDKVLRYNSARDTNTTYYGDHLIEFLEERGYYVMLLKEDVLALRIGYKVTDMKHLDRNRLFKNTWKYAEYAKYDKTKWIHPKSYNFVPGMAEPVNRNMGLNYANRFIPR